MNIGSVNIPGKTVLAPMANVTALPFRMLCRSYGCGLVFSEMLNANAIVRDNKSTLRKAATDPAEEPVAMQLFGTKEDVLASAAGKLDSDIIDINMGCPDFSVMRQGAGSALLKRPEKIRKIVSALSGIGRPLTVKIRSGLDIHHISAVGIAKIAEDAGASAVTVHARTVAQKYSGKADWSVIREVKENVSIPVIANGDINDELSAERCLKETKADLVMIGRAAIGEPFLFRRISHYLDTGELLPKQGIEEKLNDFFRYYELAKEHGLLTYPELKTHAQWFTKSIEGGRIIREKITRADTVEKIMEIVQEFDRK